MTPIAIAPKRMLSRTKSLRWLTVSGLVLIAVGLLIALANDWRNLTIDDPLLSQSTLSELGVWMADQSGEEQVVSPLAQAARQWASALGEAELDPVIIVHQYRDHLSLWMLMVAGLGLASLGLFAFKPRWVRPALLLTLLGIDLLIFIIPVIEGDQTQTRVLIAVVSLLAALVLTPAEHTSKIFGFFVALSVLFVVWEVSKSLAASTNYKITLAQPAWTYTAYDTPKSALEALQTNTVDALVMDRKDLQDLIPAYPEEADSPATDYPDLRYLDSLDRTTRVAWMPVEPEFAGRLTLAVRAEDAPQRTSISTLGDARLGTVAGSFAEERYLMASRQMVILDLKILNDLNLPRLQTIAEAFLQPARRNGEQLLIGILSAAAGYTWGEAFFGFALGATLGFILGSVFAHSRLMERSLLPYVVASQTVPILAIAPMVVIWLGASPLSVAVIAAYLTFFPVTINTLRGLQSPKPTEVELMLSYAASRWTIMWKLRLPSALPYIFTALKVSATASVVGAIIGELPSSMGDGLGRAILNFSSDYSLVSTPKLWAAIVSAACVGIIFFVSVSVIEMLVLGRYSRRD